MQVKDITAASGFGVGVGGSDLAVGAGLDLLASVADNTGLTRLVVVGETVIDVPATLSALWMLALLYCPA